MFDLNNIIVSESHIVKYNNKWIPVRDHPEAKEIVDYKEPFLYCINTSSKEINIGNIIFTDWDEIYDKSLDKILNHVTFDEYGIETKIILRENIDKYLWKGYDENTKINLIRGMIPIKNVFIGDMLFPYGRVYGIVELNKKENNLGNKEGKLYHLLVSNNYFKIGKKICPDYNYRIDSILQ